MSPQLYPGTTEEICVPIIEKNSGLKLSTNKNKHKKKIFGCSYCPERINPGDKKRTIRKNSQSNIIFFKKRFKQNI